jgi:hypothetical protein
MVYARSMPAPAVRRAPKSADLTTPLRRGLAEFTRGWRQFWQGYWQSAHSC